MAAPYAYVVEHRVIDACAPPDCRIDGRKTFGRADAVSGRPGESAGAYVAIGSDRHELFARRGTVLPPAQEIRFILPPRIEPSVLDVSFASASPVGGAFRAVLEVRVAGEAGELFQRTFEGATAPFEPHDDVALLGDEEKYFRHVRQALPPRTATTTVVLRNEGGAPLGVGAPLVLRRVEGRGPRQAFVVVFDAVPYPIFDALYAGRDESTRWISSFVGKGALFREAVSPGQLTGSFVRRFFGSDYFRTEGDPSLAGQGFDETPPERAVGPVARLAERGFFTEAIGANLYLSPVLSRIGFDADYNIEPTRELQTHPRVLAARFRREIEDHRDDDALFVLWYANTHFPWLEGRPDAPPLRVPAVPEELLDRAVLDPIWRNAFDAVTSLRDVVEHAAMASPHGERTWVLTADHGHSFARAVRAQPWRLTKELVSGDHMHCCLATSQETRTPLVIVHDHARGAATDDTARDEENARRPARETLPGDDRPLSTLAAWRVIERRLGVDLGLPPTSAFALPADRQAADESFDDGIVVSVGNSGALFGRHGDFSYRSYEPALRAAPAWEPDPAVALLLRGSPHPVGGVPAEELYQPARDPLEIDNLAAARFGELLDMRSRMSSWLAEYGDGPDHERYVYVLAFDRAVPLDVAGPRDFSLAIDGAKARLVTSSQAVDPDGTAIARDEGTPRVAAFSRVAAPRVHAEGTVFRLQDGERPLGVVDLAGAAVSTGRLVRCAASGLPLARIDGANPRLNLAVARTNCVGAPRPGQSPAPGETLFSAELVSQREKKGNASAALPELKRALERWGYVREK